MARRKKEAPEIHQRRIANAAGRLFLEKGILNTTMDEIAKAAGYSKATLYAYFKNKDDIAAFLAWQSMTMLRDIIAKVISEDKPYKDRFIDMGFAIAGYTEKYSEYSHILMKPISFHTEDTSDTYYKRTFQTGEEINSMLLKCLSQGSAEGFFSCNNIQIADVFQIWGMLFGLIEITQQKEQYIKLVIGKEKDEFLREGLERLYKLIEA